MRSSWILWTLWFLLLTGQAPTWTVLSLFPIAAYQSWKETH